jgi:hypothetical protein
MEDAIIYNDKDKLKKRDRLGAISDSMERVLVEARVASIKRDVESLKVMQGIAEKYMQSLKDEIALLNQTQT